MELDHRKGHARITLSQPAQDFCDECLQVLTTPRPSDSLVHKASYSALRVSIERGCEFCAILHEAWIEKLSIKQDQPVDEIIELVCQLESRSRGPGQFKIIPRTAIKSESSQPTVIDELAFGPYYGNPKFQALIEVGLALVGGDLDKIGGRMVPEHVDLQLCRQWIHHCVETHPRCAQLIERELPTRIIDVGPADGSRGTRLISGLDQKGKYVALSHCWGQREPLVTTTSNLQDRLCRIEWDSLPKTFQDAVHVTRGLGYRYLWIDSLCIIQDDSKDWKRECPLMVSVYSNAAVTIAVAGAKDAYEGFLRSRESKDVSKEESKIISIKLSDRSDPAIVLVTPRIKSETPWGVRSFEFPHVLASRAWTLQERILSPRVLYFGTSQAYFECNTGLACESFRHPAEGLVMSQCGFTKDAFAVADDRDKLLREWYRLLEHYSSCSLSYGADKLPAFAGLASLFQQRLGDEYCAGLWKGDFIRGLCWKRPHHETEKSRKSANPSGIQPPTWSWASCDFTTIHPNSFPYGSVQIEVLSVAVDTGDSGPLGQVSGGELRLRGKLKKAKLSTWLAEDWKADLRIEDKQSLGCDVGLDKPDGGIPPSLINAEGKADTVSTREIDCLLVTEMPDPQSRVNWNPGGAILLLERMTSKPDLMTFRRIGVAYWRMYNRTQVESSALTRWFDWSDTAHSCICII